MKIKLFIRYIIKEFLVNTFRLFGGVYVTNYVFRKAPFYLVLNYHNFSKYNNYSIKKGSNLETRYGPNFEKQMRFLKKNFTFLYPEEFFEAEPENGLNLLICFDDGYKDNYDIAFPILKKHQVKTVIFVVTSIIGTSKWLQHDKLRLLAFNNPHLKNEVESTLRKLNQGLALPKNITDKSNQYFSASSYPNLYMNWSDLKEIQAQGIKIMPHTVNHTVLSSLNKLEQTQEINDSINRVNTELHQESVYFSYPNGLYNPITIEILKYSGIKYGFTTNSGANTKKDKRLEIKRIGINASDSISTLLLKLFMAAVK